MTRLLYIHLKTLTDIKESTMTIQFERQSLYEEVWTIPLTQLGKKYGLSDNGVRKACIAMNIPLPKSGHWTKIAAGYQVPRTPLPDTSEVTTYISNPKPAEPASPEKTEDAIWLNKHESFELNPINRIVVDLLLKKFHPLLLDTHNEFLKKVKELEKLIIEAKKEAIRPKGKKWEPNINSSRLKAFEQNGQLLELHRWGMPLRLTTKTWERGLAITNALFTATEKRGFEIIRENKSNEVRVKLNGGEVYIRMSEKLKQDILMSKDDPELDLLLGPTIIKVPTGILRLHLRASGSYSEIEISDTPDKPLQENLNQVFCKIYKLIVKSRVKSREWAEWQLKRDEEDKLREERERVHQEELRTQAIEAQRRNDLLKEANDWQNAELIYKYINHLDEIENAYKDERFLEWKKWAIKVANELDPTQNTLKQIIID